MLKHRFCAIEIDTGMQAGTVLAWLAFAWYKQVLHDVNLDG